MVFLDVLWLKFTQSNLHSSFVPYLDRVVSLPVGSQRLDLKGEAKVMELNGS